uniref:Cell division cycle associated 3 n=1 Tax=Phocoena sinus TaxID=42100 RepID=A0A8C9DZS1_PHOSS
MGSAKSVPVTPARPPPHNKLLARVADPRSPSAGILRTPIQVESSPQPNLPAGEQLEGPKQSQDSDPRSPTLGIARTPMKTSGEPPSPLVKQLSDVFETEDPTLNLPPEPVLPLETPSSSPLDLPLGTRFSLEDQMSPWSQTELPSRQVFSKEEIGHASETAVASQDSDKPLRDPETPWSSGSKCSRWKANSKVLGRSPLTILQDDNSPGTLTPRQVKQAAGGVVRARADGLSVGEELRVQVTRGQDSDLGSPLPFLPSPCSCPGDSRPSCFPQPLWPPPPSLPPPARSLFTADVCHMPAAAGLPTPFPAPQYFHVAGESTGLREDGQRAQGHMVRRAEAVPDANDYSRLDQCVSTGPSTNAYPESHHEEISHNPMEGKSTENWLVLFKNVNVTEDRERAQTVPV